MLSEYRHKDGVHRVEMNSQKRNSEQGASMMGLNKGGRCLKLCFLLKCIERGCSQGIVNPLGISGSQGRGNGRHIS